MKLVAVKIVTSVEAEDLVAIMAGDILRVVSRWVRPDPERNGLYVTELNLVRLSPADDPDDRATVTPDA